MKKLALFTVLLFAFCFPAAACKNGGGGGDGDEVEYIAREYGSAAKPLYIAAYDAPDSNYAAQEYFDDLADAGVNLLIPQPGSFGNSASREILLDRAQAAGMKTMATDNGLSNEGSWNTSQLEQYMSHPAFAGVHIKDEPGTGDFNVLAQKSALWKQFTVDNSGQMSDKLFYVNLFPGYVTPGYKQYVTDYVDMVKPQFISYDYYPLLGGQPVAGAVKIRQSYFIELDMISHIAKQNGIPVWSIILTAGHEAMGDVYHTPDAMWLRWQMAVVMTYGVRSIAHYNYRPMGARHYAFIDFNGKRTAVFDAVKTANLEVRAWENVYMNFEWEGTAGIIGSHGRLNLMLYALEYSLFKDEIDGVNNIVSTDDILCGVFKDAEGRPGYMLTNATNPYEEKSAAVTVGFDEEYKGVIVYEKGVPRDVIGLDKNNKVKVDLEPGEGKFLIPLMKK